MVETIIKKIENEAPNPREGRKRAGSFATGVGLAINLVLAAMKMGVGYLSGILSIFGDGLNNLMDSASSLFSLLSFKVASKPSDEEHPFGHARFEYISSSLIAVVLLVTGIQLMQASVEKIRQPAMVEMGFWSIFSLSLSIALKLYQYSFYRRVGKILDSQVISAAAADSLSDVLSTLGILLSLFLSPLLHYPLDGWISAVVSLLIMKNGLDVLKETYDKLMGSKNDPELLMEIRKEVVSFPCVKGVHDMLIHDYGPGQMYMSMDVEVDADTSLVQAHEISDALERKMWEERGIKTNVHLDPMSDDPRVKEKKRRIMRQLSQLGIPFGVHDLQTYTDGKKSRTSLDLVIPWQDQWEDDETREKAEALIRQIYPEDEVYIRVDNAGPEDESGQEEEKE